MYAGVRVWAKGSVFKNMLQEWGVRAWGSRLEFKLKGAGFSVKYTPLLLMKVGS